MDEFEEMVEDLRNSDLDYKQVDITETPMATNCVISGGMMVPNHAGCTMGDVPVLFIEIEFVGSEESLKMVIPYDSPLGMAILSGALTHESRKRIEKFLE